MPCPGLGTGMKGLTEHREMAVMEGVESAVLEVKGFGVTGRKCPAPPAHSLYRSPWVDCWGGGAGQVMETRQVVQHRLSLFCLTAVPQRLWPAVGGRAHGPGELRGKHSL